MRYAKQGGFIDRRTGRRRTVRLTYSCSGPTHCTARDLATLETYVVAVVLERLSRSDVRDALNDTDAPPAATVALAEAAELRERLRDAVAQFTGGVLSGATLARVEADLLPRIADAERRARVVGLPSVAADLSDADDIATAWDLLSREQQREVIRALVDVTVDPVKVRGRTAFDPSRVRITWKA